MPARLALGCSAFLRKALLRTCSANVPGAVVLTCYPLTKLNVNLLNRLVSIGRVKTLPYVI